MRVYKKFNLTDINRNDFMKQKINIYCLILFTFILNNITSSQFKSNILLKPTSTETKIVGRINYGSSKLTIYQGSDFLKVRDNFGKLIWQKEFDRTIKTVASDFSNQIGIIIHNSKVDETFEFRIFNPKGELQYKYQIPLYEDDLLPTIKLSSSGQSAIFRPEINLLTILSKDGNILYDKSFTKN